jgi:hypothetical protein
MILRAIESDAFDYVNLHWYFVNDFHWPAILAAERRDLGVFIISPTDKGGKLYEPPAKLRQLCAPLSPIQFNDLYCLARPQVHTLSIGAARPEDFDEHIAALEHYDRAADIIAPVLARLGEEIERTHGAAWARTWSENLPDYTAVPGEVNVPEILRLWHFAKALDLTDWARMRYNLMGNAGHWFPGNNAAAFDDQQLRSALAKHPFRERIPRILREAHALLHGEQQQRLSQSD